MFNLKEANFSIGCLFTKNSLFLYSAIWINPKKNEYLRSRTTSMVDVKVNKKMKYE